MAISSGSEYKGEKLRGKENHRIWKTILESDLKSKRLWKYVTAKANYPADPPSVEPSSSTDNPLSPPAELQPNYDKDTKARLVLQEDYEAESEWAKEMWEALTGLFEAINLDSDSSFAMLSKRLQVQIGDRKGSGFDEFECRTHVTEARTEAALRLHAVSPPT